MGHKENKLKQIVFTDDDSSNWFLEKYFYSGANARYWTFQVALNLLAQRGHEVLIVETGCQREVADIGAGMSTSIFGEFCHRHGGKLFTVDNSQRNMRICQEVTQEFALCIYYQLSDSIEWLGKPKGFSADLLYLDSLDYPVGDEADDVGLQEAAQRHIVAEFEAAARSGILGPKTILLLDDNRLPGGGKPKILKQRLVRGAEWKCLMDWQQSLWVREL